MSRILCGLAMVAIALPTSGCPPLSPLVLGTWLFEFGDKSAVARSSAAALILLEGGATEHPDPRPPEADVGFPEDYVFLWAVDGSDFTLSRYEKGDQPANAEVAATATVESRNSLINGTYLGSASFTARPL